MILYNFTKLFLKDINKTIIYCNSNNRVTACSYCKLLDFNVTSGRVIGTDQGSFCFLRVLVSQNDCLIKVMLSVFRVHELVILHHHIHTRKIMFRTLLQDTKILMMFLLSDVEKFIDWCETKTTNVDPNIDSMFNHWKIIISSLVHQSHTIALYPL